MITCFLTGLDGRLGACGIKSYIRMLLSDTELQHHGH